jgi:hypothetical protein
MLPTHSTGEDESVYTTQQFLTQNHTHGIVTDSGSQFKNEAMTTFCGQCNIDLRHTLPYSKEENGIVERFNKEAMRHLRAYVYEKRVRNKWHRYLFHIQQVYNNLLHESINDTPNHIHYGARFAPDPVVLTVIDAATGTERPVANVAEYAAANANYQQTIIDIAMQYQQDLNERHLMERTNDQMKHYEVGDLVLLSPHRSMGGVRRPDNKLDMQRRGPFRISAILGNKLTLQHLSEVKFLDVFMREVTPFMENQGENAEPPEVTSAKDGGNYGVGDELIVAAIVGHRGQPQNKNTMEFLVHWEAYYGVPDTWEPWENVHYNALVQEYCRARQELRRLLPRRRRQNNGA